MASWVKTTGSNIPEGALRAGYEDNGTPLFIARAKVEGVFTPGKCGEHLKVSTFHMTVSNRWSTITKF